MSSSFSCREYRLVVEKANRVFRLGTFHRGLAAAGFEPEDFSQEVFKHLFAREAKETGFLGKVFADEGILVNFIRQRAVDIVRIRNRRLPEREYEEHMPAWAEPEPGRYDPEPAVLRAIEGTAVRNALKRLTTRDRTVIGLRFWYEVSPHCIAVLIGRPVREVYQALAAAKNRLKAKLAG